MLKKNKLKKYIKIKSSVKLLNTNIFANDDLAMLIYKNVKNIFIFNYKVNMLSEEILNFRIEIIKLTLIVILIILIV